jgi:hypothetical protein
MRDQLLSVAQFEAKYPIILDGDGNPTPRKERLPQRPLLPLAFNATNATTSIFNRATSIADSAEAFKVEMKANMIISIGADIAYAMADPIEGHDLLEPWDIVAYITANYGTLDADDIAFLQSDIKTWNYEKDFRTNAARMERTFSELSRLNFYGSQLEKIEVLRQATRGVGGMSIIFDDYEDKHPDLATQVYADLITHIVVKLPAASAKYARAEASRAEASAADRAAHSAEIAVLQAELATLKVAQANSAAAGTKGAKDAKAPAAKPAKDYNIRPDGKRRYCFFHGYQGHDGDAPCDKLELHYPGDDRYTRVLINLLDGKGRVVSV